MVGPGLKLEQGMLLFILLNKLKPELLEEGLPGGEGEHQFGRHAHSPALCGVLGHKGHGVPDNFLQKVLQIP